MFCKTGTPFAMVRAGIDSGRLTGRGSDPRRCAKARVMLLHSCMPPVGKIVQARLDSSTGRAIGCGPMCRGFESRSTKPVTAFCHAVPVGCGWREPPPPVRPDARPAPMAWFETRRKAWRKRRGRTFAAAASPRRNAGLPRPLSQATPASPSAPKGQSAGPASHRQLGRGERKCWENS